jgi:hypothetical protein
MIERVISGGQVGTDQAALQAARACGISTGGWAPRGWLTEAGPAPWLVEYGLVECQEGESEGQRYRARRRRCVRDCHAALLFGDIKSPGSRGLNRDCSALGKPLVWVRPGLTTPRQIFEWLTEAPYITRLLVAGNRASWEPGIGERVERFLLVVFRSLARTQRPRD